MPSSVEDVELTTGSPPSESVRRPNCELPEAAWGPLISHLSSPESPVYWIVVDGAWRILAASRSFQSRILAAMLEGEGHEDEASAGGVVGGELRFLDSLTRSTAADLEDRRSWGLLAGKKIELIHPVGETASSASYTFLEIDGGYLLVGQDESRQLELVSQMSGLVVNLETEMERERALGESLQSLLSVDHLTGVASRRQVEDVLRAAWDRWIRTKDGFAVISIDVDRFKSVNDRFGHDAGDEVLKRVASAIATTVRDSDTVGRLGGEEFIVVTPLAAEEPLARMAERIRRRVAEAEMPEGIEPATISLGVATVSAAAANVLELLKQADTALYAAKRAGRDRVVLASELAVPPGAGAIPEE